MTTRKKSSKKKKSSAKLKRLEQSILNHTSTYTNLSGIRHARVESMKIDEKTRTISLNVRIKYYADL